MFLFFEPTTITVIIGGIFGAGGTVLGYFLFRRKHNAEADALQITNDMSDGLARKKLLGDITHLGDEIEQLKDERDKANEDARAAKNLYAARDSEVKYLREQAREFYLAEGGCLERERMNSERIAKMERDQVTEIAEIKRDYQQQIDDIKEKFEEAMQFKSKNSELAEENTRLLAENEGLRNRVGNS